jgi:hypothetical protein
MVKFDISFSIVRISNVEVKLFSARAHSIKLRVSLAFAD